MVAPHFSNWNADIPLKQPISLLDFLSGPCHENDYRGCRGEHGPPDRWPGQCQSLVCLSLGGNKIGDKGAGCWRRCSCSALRLSTCSFPTSAIEMDLASKASDLWGRGNGVTDTRTCTCMHMHSGQGHLRYNTEGRETCVCH